MRPISSAALSASASERLIALATPKKDFQLDHPIKCNRYLNINSSIMMRFNKDTDVQDQIFGKYPLG